MYKIIKIGKSNSKEIFAFFSTKKKRIVNKKAYKVVALRFLSKYCTGVYRKCAILNSLLSNGKAVDNLLTKPILNTF